MRDAVCLKHHSICRVRQWEAWLGTAKGSYLAYSYLVHIIPYYVSFLADSRKPARPK
jgi:hypothetical protein